jgi:hypothetical protein
MYFETIAPFVPLILMGTIFGLISRYIAIKKGKSATTWFLLGFFFQLIGLIIIAALPSEKDETEKAELRKEVQELKDRLEMIEDKKL